MNASILFKDLLNEIGLFLKDEGFSRQGDLFYLVRAVNWALIDFQKSRKSTRDEIIFTVNVGICSKGLLNFFNPEFSKKIPSIEDCQWRDRLGFLLPTRCDKWWVIKNEKSFLLIDELKNSLSTFVIPVISHHVEDSQLSQEWLSGNSPGLTDFQRLMNLSVLLKFEHRNEELNQTLRELTDLSLGKPSAIVVKQHIQKLTK